MERKVLNVKTLIVVTVIILLASSLANLGVRGEVTGTGSVNGTINSMDSNSIATNSIAGSGSTVVTPDNLYKVEHYIQNKDFTGYELRETEEIRKQENSIVTATPKNYTGFTYEVGNPDNVLQGTVLNDDSLVLKVYYTRNTYTVTLNPDGGIINSGNITNYVYGIGAILPNNISKEGYKFVGWYDAENTNSNYRYQVAISSTESGNKNYTAIWTANSNTIYKVEYYGQNKMLTGYDLIESNNEVGETNTVATIAPKTIEGFTYDASNSNNVLSGIVAEDGKLVLKVYYTRNTYSVSLDANGGTIDPSQNITSYVYGAGEMLPTNVTKEGYTFVGWYDNSKVYTGNNYEVGISSTEIGNKVYVAIWKANTNTLYKVEYYGQKRDLTGYDLMETRSFPGTTDATVSAPTKSFEGYVENTSYAGRVENGQVKPDGSLVLKLYYDIVTNTVTFKDGYSVVATQNVQYGRGATAPVLTKPGYTLSWDKTFDNIKEDTEVNAVWTANLANYVVEYYVQNTVLSGYELYTTDVLEAKTDDTVTAEIKDLTGFTYDSTNFANTLSGTISASSNLVLRVCYTRNTYNVSLDTDGGVINSGNITSYVYGVGGVLPSNLTKEGYEFLGWYDNEKVHSGYQYEVGIGTTEYGDKTYHAVWKANGNVKYKVEHYLQNTDLTTYTLKDTDVVTGTTNTVAVALEKSYVGFHENVSHADRIEKGTILEDSTLVLKLFYDRNVYSVTLNKNKGTVNSGNVIQYYYGLGAILPTDITRPGYDFLGWYDNSDFEGDQIFKIGKSELDPKEFFAKWIARDDTDYKVEYYKQDTDLIGYTLEESVVLEGTTDTTAVAEIKDYIGFTYDDVTSIVSGNIEGDESLVLKIYYSRNKYPVVLVTNGGTITYGNITEYVYQAEDALPTSVNKAGYTFAGWFDNEELEGSVITNINVEYMGEKTYYAKWEPRDDTQYIVEHYRYDEITEMFELYQTDILAGTTEEIAVAEPKEYEGYIFDEENIYNVKEGQIIGDGSLVLRLYYAIYIAPVEVESSVYEIDDEYIYRISPETTVDEFLSNITTNGDTIVILDKDGNEVTSVKDVYDDDNNIIGQEDNIIVTGYTLKITTNKGQEKELTIAVTGDLDGNGMIDALDLSAMNQCMLKTLTLTGALEKAADINGDGELSALDLSGMNQSLLHTLSL